MLKKQLKNVKDFIITIIPLQMNPYNIGFFYPEVKTNLLRWKIYPQISTREDDTVCFSQYLIKMCQSLWEITKEKCISKSL